MSRLQSGDISGYEHSCLYQAVPFKCLADVGQVHLNAVFVLVGLNVHILEAPSLSKFCDHYTILLGSRDGIKSELTFCVQWKFPQWGFIRFTCRQCTAVQVDMV